jgi:hypothetical protein
MNTRERLQIQILKTGLIICIILFFELQSCSGQKFKQFVDKNQVGLEGSFGIKAFRLSSNISAINHLSVIEEGGAIGLTAGARAVRLNIRQGFYYSATVVPYTIDEIRSAGSIDFYPLQVLPKNNVRLQPYLTAGIENNIFKMYGHYGPETSSTKTVNYSTAEAPYLGKISTVQVNVGIGLAYSIREPGYFVNIFSEAKYGTAISTRTPEIFFRGTSLNNQLTVNIGVGFGYHQNPKPNFKP